MNMHSERALLVLSVPANCLYPAHEESEVMRWQVVIPCRTSNCQWIHVLSECDSYEKAEEKRKSHVKQTITCPHCGKTDSYCGADSGGRVRFWTPNVDKQK